MTSRTPLFQTLKVPFDSQGYTHTHTHTRREVCVASILPGKEARPSCPERGLCEAHARGKETDENEKDERDKKCVWLPMKKNQVKRDNR